MRGRCFSALASCLFTLSCGQSPGTFEVVFKWTDPEPAEGTVWAHVRVEHRPGGKDVPGDGVAAAPAVLWYRNARIELTAVPNGSDRVVVVEMKAAEDKASEILYFGLSEPFTLEAGVDTKVEVAVPLRRTPGFDDGISSLEILNAVDGHVSTPEVRLRLTTRPIDRIQIAQDPGFTYGAADLDADDYEVASTSTSAIHELTYDLNANLDCDRGECADGTRQIFARVANEQGYRSEVLSTRVTLDTRPPSIQEVRFSPPSANLGTHVRLTLVADEDLGETDADQVLVWEGAPNPGFVFEGRSSLVYIYSFTVGETTPETTYSLSALHIKDKYGNAASPAVEPAATLVIDRTPPQLTNLTVSSTRAPELASDHFALGDTFNINFMLVGAAHVDVTVGGVPATCPAELVDGLNACTFTVGSDLLPPSSESTQPIDIRAMDTAGNSIADSISIVVDSLAPSLIADSESVVLVPAANNPLGNDISALGVGGSARVQFSVSESLASEPTVLAAAAGAPEVALAIEGQFGLNYIFRHAVQDSAAAQGAHSISIELLDQAGNRTIAESTIAFEVDTLGPPPPDVDTPSRILFRRTPWGRVSGAGPQFGVRGSDGATEPGAILRVIHPLSGIVANAMTSTTGSFDLPSLPMTDTPVLSLQAIDRAGNQSAVVDIRDGEWIANLRGKTATNLLTNPHRVAGALEVAVPLEQVDREPSTAEYQGISGIGPAYSVSARQGWENLAQGVVNPGARSLAAMTYDPEHGNVILFGGFFNQDLGDTLVWDGVRWTDLSSPIAAPSARRRSSMAFDSARGVAVLFGGSEFPNGSEVVLGDTWELRGSEWVEIPGPGPAPRQGHSMVHDSARGVIVMVGGALTDGTQTNETWEYDGAWTFKTPSCEPAPCELRPDEAFAMAYDEVNEMVVRFGGTSVFANDSDVWTYDGSTWRRQNLPGPRPCLGPRMAFDRQRGRVVMFGGLAFFPYGAVSDTWLWDGSTNTWTMDPSPTRAVPRFDHAMVYADKTHELFVYGGQLEVFGGPYTGDAAVHDGVRWRPATQNASPGARVSAAMSPMPDGSGVFLFGGRRFAGGTSTVTADAWRFDGRIWSPIATTGLAPRTGASAVVDPLRDRILLFGGSSDDVPSNELTAYDGTDWIPLSRDGPSPRFLQSMAYDSDRDLLVVFGGFIDDGVRTNDTWIYVPTSTATPWQQAPPPPPELTARAGAALAYDPVSQRFIMFGGDAPGATASVALDETWSFDPDTMQWTQLTPTLRPMLRTRAQLVFEPDRNRLVLFGGDRMTGGHIFSDTWEWAGTTWVEVETSVRPPPRQNHGLAYGGTPGSLFTYGGVTDNDDVWRKKIPSEIRPGIKVSFDWAASQTSSSAISAITVSLGASGTGGVRVDYWNPQYGHWSPLAASTASTTPALVVGQLVDQSAITGDGQLHYLLQAVDTLGTAAAEPSVALDDVEVTIDYRLP